MCIRERDEAMQIIGEKFNEIMERYGGQAIFNMCGTSRQWAVSYTLLAGMSSSTVWATIIQLVLS